MDKKITWPVAQPVHSIRAAFLAALPFVFSFQLSDFTISPFNHWPVRHAL